jgi:hypothetical protein
LDDKIFTYFTQYKISLMRRPLLLTAVLLLMGVQQTLAAYVWSTDIAPVLFNNCVSCHRTGGIAPFPLTTYAEAFAFATQIKHSVQDKHMPPWPPDVNYSRLAHERVLTQTEINKIVNWVDSGAQSGVISQAPPVPVFSNNGDIPGTADLTVTIPTFTSTATTDDVYQCFVIPGGQSVDKFITAFEAIPGNREIVHHVLVFADTTAAHVCQSLDNASPGPGYVSFGGVGESSAIMIGGWVPGTAPLQYPNNFGVRLHANADIVVQIHYPAGSSGYQDSTKVRFFFSPTNVRDVFIVPVLNHEQSSVISPYPLFIPADSQRTFTEHFQAPIAVSLLGVAPHMHLIGRSIKAFGVTMAQDTQKIINIPNWHFHWQGFYMFPKIKKVTPGTTLYASAWYDNTTGNPLNPNNPPQPVTAGEATTDEMMICYLIFANYQAGDENIVIDSEMVATQIPYTYYKEEELLEPYPNPASHELIIKSHFNNATTGTLELVSIDGKLVRQFAANHKFNEGYNVATYSVSNIASGNYVLRLRTSKQTLTQKVIVQH